MQVDFDLAESPQLWSGDQRSLARKSCLRATPLLLSGLMSAGRVGAYGALTLLDFGKICSLRIYEYLPLSALKQGIKYVCFFMPLFKPSESTPLHTTVKVQHGEC